MFSATLKFKGREYDVRYVDYLIKRDIDAKGRPSSHLYGGLIRLIVESSEETTILESMVTQFIPHAGTIELKKGDEEATMKVLNWEQGYIIKFKEIANVEGKKGMVVDFTISARVIKVGDTVFEQNWPDK